MSQAPVELLSSWLANQLPADSWQWLDGRREELRNGFTDRALHITLGMIPRRLGKADLVLDAAAIEAARLAREAWNPDGWSVADAARVLVLVETAEAGNQAFADRFVDLCRTADVGEAIALYRGLPLYPEPGAFESQAGEGLRTNMRAVFEAVAHRNPFPREQFDQARWNQMVLKALFVDSTLHPIQGLDERANPELAHILCDYAHERWAAGRAVSPELWRCVGPHAEGAMLEDLKKVLAKGDELERKAAAIALGASRAPQAKTILASEPALAQSIDSGALDWSTLVAHLQ